MDSVNVIQVHQHGVSAVLHPLCLFKYIFYSAIHPESLGAPCPYAALGGELLGCVRASASVLKCVRECVRACECV